ncbi:MAG TPA: flagellar type III secretion system pore protein FliP [Fimbriimonadaceae bacterium]|nr:flagellar type III secretion system pore protein FliP [Fimbriimonadaceae bacterium]
MRFDNRTRLRLLAVLGLLGLVGFAAAQGLPLPHVTVGVDGTDKHNDVASSLQILALLTVLSLAPAILMLTTAFTRIVIILSFLRQALGTPSIPPNQVVIGLSLFLTFFVMQPTYNEVSKSAIQPLMAHRITAEQAMDNASKPMKDFMLKNTYKTDIELFMNIRHETAQSVKDVSMVTLIPAFIISELKTAFVVGFYVFIPFLIIDLIVASSLMSMGMMMLPPTVVSLPAKILVFVLANGWTTLIAAIMAGYST